MTRKIFLVLITQFLVTSSAAFSANSVKKPFGVATALESSLSLMDEQDAQYLMAKARECAFSDTCSIEESQERLADVLHIQEACVGGTVLGHDICDDQLAAAEIVSRLRVNIETHKHGLR